MFISASLDGKDAEQMQRVGMVRINCQYLAVKLLRFSETPDLVQL